MLKKENHIIIKIKQPKFKNIYIGKNNYLYEYKSSLLKKTEPIDNVICNKDEIKLISSKKFNKK